MVFQNVETVCVICAKSVEWVLQLKRQVNCLDYIHSKILRQSLGLLACAQLYFPLKLIAVPCMYGRGEEYGLFCWASARAEGILICVIISRTSHIRPLSILHVYIFLLFGAKIYTCVVLFLVSALLSQPKPTKVDCKCVYE